MTYGELKASVLSLINQYTIAGSDVEPTYNNQQDYINRIPMLADDAQMQIATTAKLIPALFFAKDLAREKHGNGYLYTVPPDFYKLRKNVLIDTGSYPAKEIPIRGFVDEHHFMFRDDIQNPDIIISYYRFPQKLGINPSDMVNLDNTEDAQRVVALHVASHIVMYDDAYQHSQLYNEYEVQMSRLTNGIVSENQITEDFYSGNELDDEYRW